MRRMALALLFFTVFSSNAFAVDAAVAPLALARQLVEQVSPTDTSYTHASGPVTWAGLDGATESVSHTDCSGLVNALYQHAYGFDRDRFVALFGRARPLAASYHDAIEKEQGFTRLMRVDALQPGDLIAIRYPPGSGDTGHLMVVAAMPQRRTASAPLIDGTTQWEVRVIDSARSGHGPTDTRSQPQGASREGVGEGVFRLYADADATIVGYSWSTLAKSSFYGPAQRDLVAGRLALPAAH